MTRTPFNLVSSHDELQSAPNGSAIYTRNEQADMVGMIVKCPGCGSESYLGLNERAEEHWTNSGTREKPTLHPSVHHVKSLGGCGWHGWLKNGVWEG